MRGSLRVLTSWRTLLPFALASPIKTPHSARATSWIRIGLESDGHGCFSACPPMRLFRRSSRARVGTRRGSHRSSTIWLS
ncbi:hypothetical protein BC826DRAFT_1034640 [Russula brevipes]|nr:hypothetical protein BC826DRAFT_1034640 [Russula brevipes]